jgi:predicted O-methyltransferase YrrM
MAGSEQDFSEAQAASWYDGKAFSSDWTSWHFPNWAKLLGPWRGVAARIMEIGSWEGRSALFFLNYLPRARLVCIDTFAGGEEHQADPNTVAHHLPEIEQRFDANVAAFKDRIEKIKAPSTTALAELGLDGRRFDIAYVDGSHRAVDVYSDGILTWPLIVHGGLLIFDDYQWEYMPETLSNPKQGIDSFLRAFEGDYRIVHHAYQIAVEKI